MGMQLSGTGDPWPRGSYQWMLQGTSPLKSLFLSMQLNADGDLQPLPGHLPVSIMPHTEQLDGLGGPAIMSNARWPMVASS